MVQPFALQRDLQGKDGEAPFQACWAGGWSEMARLMRCAIKTDASGALASAGVLEALPQEGGIIGGLATRRIVEGAPHFGTRGEPWRR